jgi:hypothetical protein
MCYAMGMVWIDQRGSDKAKNVEMISEMNDMIVRSLKFVWSRLMDFLHGL